MQKLSLIDRWAEDKNGFSFLENDETENSRIERLNKLSLKVNGGPGSGNFNPGQGRGIGKPSKSSILSKKMKSLSWNETQDLLRDKETRQIIKEIGLKTYDDLWNMWSKVKIEDFTEKDIKEIDIDDAFDVVRKNIRLSALEGWFVNADSNYKPEIVTKILENKELRNAGLNIAYYNYKNRFESDISFSDFIKTPISLYRGEHGQTHVTQDWFDAYTPAKDIAEGFGEIVTEIKIKPIETLGAYFDNAESEYLVLTKTSMLKNSIGNARINRLDKILNFKKENLDYRYDVKAYKEYLKEWLKHKDEPEYLNGGVLSFAEFWEHDIDYEFEDYKKILELIDEYNKKKELVINGGPGSGNFNPGQGRGVGKPASGHTPHGDTQYSAKNYLSKKEYENIVNYSSEDNFTEEELDAIAGYTKSMGYGASCDLNQAIRENDFGEIIERENVVFPEDDSQIVTWKENKEFIEQKIKDKKQHDAIKDTIDLAVSTFRKDDKSNEKDREVLNDFIKKQREEMNKLYKSYSEYENYIKNYEKGLYKDIKDDQKMWTIDEDKLSKISVVKLREKQKSESKRFDEVLEIPRLMWSMYYDDKPITTDTLANKYQRDFKDLDKLDNIIKNKGFVLDKDITVTRRVANAKVIENQIKNKGEYTQNGITSVTAAKSIGKRMPSGVHMGDDLIRITIPKGTRVISTYNPFVRDTQKSADKYNNGKLTEEDNRNLRMIKGQNELILPSGSKFISPDGNKFIQNEDGSYQLILKAEGKISNNRIERLNFLQEIFNGGPGSGNFNPGQGRGVGKPANGSFKKFEYDFNVEPSSRSGIVTKDYMDYLLNNKELDVKVDENKIKEYFEKKCFHKDRFKNFEEYKDKLLHLQIQKEGGNISDAADFQRYELQNMVKDKVLYSESGTFEALTRYVDGATPSGYGRRGKHPRKNFDEKFGISKFIDKNPSLNYGEKPIYRGLNVTKEFLNSAKIGDKVDMRGVSSWTADEKEAQLFLDGSLVKKGSEKVIFENVQKEKKNTMIYPISNQTEVLLSDTNKCKIVNIEERILPIKGNNNEKAIYITVEFD